MDLEVCKSLQRLLNKQGMTFVLGAAVQSAEVGSGPVRIAYRKTFVTEIEARLAAAIGAHLMPEQDVALAAPALVGELFVGLIGPLAPETLEDPAKARDAAQVLTLLALRGVGVVDALARGLVVQTPLPRPDEVAG